MLFYQNRSPATRIIYNAAMSTTLMCFWVKELLTCSPAWQNLDPQSVAIANNKHSEMLACIAIFICGREKPVARYLGNSQWWWRREAAEYVRTIYHGTPRVLLGILIAVTIPVLHLSCWYVMIYAPHCVLEEAIVSGSWSTLWHFGRGNVLRNAQITEVHALHSQRYSRSMQLQTYLASSLAADGFTRDFRTTYKLNNSIMLQGDISHTR